MYFIDKVIGNQGRIKFYAGGGGGNDFPPPSFCSVCSVLKRFR